MAVMTAENVAARSSSGRAVGLGFVSSYFIWTPPSANMASSWGLAHPRFRADGLDPVGKRRNEARSPRTCCSPIHLVGMTRPVESVTVDPKIVSAMIALQHGDAGPRCGNAR